MKTRICCFCETWENGGIEAFLRNVLTRLDKEKFTVDIAVVKFSENIFSDDLKKSGVEFFEIPNGLRDFKKLLAKRNYGVVHLNVYHAFSLRYAKAAYKAGVPKIIAHSHNTALRPSVTRPLKMLVHNASKMIYDRYVTDFWACSKNAAEFLFTERSARKFRFIPNGIDTEKFRFSAETRAKYRAELNAENSFVIGCVGRLCEQKNQSFLLDVLKKALEIQENCKLLLIGDGDLKSELQIKAERLGVSETVIFYGVSSEVNKLMSAMDVLAMPSIFEGFGIVVMEAQCVGLPVVCSENIPQEAIVCSETQQLSLSEGATAWADALLQKSVSGFETADHESAVRTAGFDISSVCEMIAKYFLWS